MQVFDNITMARSAPNSALEEQHYGAMNSLAGQGAVGIIGHRRPITKSSTAVSAGNCSNQAPYPPQQGQCISPFGIHQQSPSNHTGLAAQITSSAWSRSTNTFMGSAEIDPVNVPFLSSQPRHNLYAPSCSSNNNLDEMRVSKI